MNTSSFLTKLSFILFLLAVASGTAGFCAWKYWHFMFDVLGYGSTDFVKLNAENQAMKTPLNLTMYTMPVSFGCAAAGFLVASGLALLLDGAGEAIAHCAALLSLMRSKDGKDA